MTLPEPSGWQSCPPGELTELGMRLRRRRSRRNFLRTVYGGSVLAAAGGAAAIWLSRDKLAYWLLPDATYGGIACTEVRSLAAAYGKGDVPADVAMRIRDHLPKCWCCRRFYQSLGLTS